MKAPLLSLPSQAMFWTPAATTRTSDRFAGSVGSKVALAHPPAPPGLGTMTMSAMPPMLPSNTMLPPVLKTEPGTPLTTPAVPWKVIELTVGTTGVGTIEDGRSPAGGAKKSRPVGGASCDAALDARQRIDVRDEVVVQRRHPVRVQEAHGVAVEDEAVGIQAAQVDRYWNPSVVTAHRVDSTW